MTRNCSYKRYIFFSDLHGNYYALQQFYDYLCKLSGKTKLYFLGDLIGYYKFDPRVIEIFDKMFTDFDLEIVLGNHDAKFLNKYFNTSFKTNCNVPLLGDILINKNLRTKIKEILKTAKIINKIKVGNHEITMSHGGVSDPLNKYYYSDLSFLSGGEEKFVGKMTYVFGHTHRYFMHKDKNNLFINIGSLGMPRNEDICGSFLEMNLSSFEIKKIMYNLDLQFEYNDNLPNHIKNRVYFGKSSNHIEKNLTPFSNSEIEIFNSLGRKTLFFKRLIFIDNEIKILKFKNTYLKIDSNAEREYSNINPLMEELYEKI